MVSENFYFDSDTDTKIGPWFRLYTKDLVGVYPYLTSSNPQKLFQEFLLIRPYRKVLPWSNIQEEMEEVERVIWMLAQGNK